MWCEALEHLACFVCEASQVGVARGVVYVGGAPVAPCLLCAGVEP